MCPMNFDRFFLGTANIVFGPYVQSQADVGDLSTLKPMSLADIEKAYSTSVIAASKGIFIVFIIFVCIIFCRAQYCE